MARLKKRPNGGTLPTRQEIEDWNKLMTHYNNYVTTNKIDPTLLDRSKGNTSLTIWDNYTQSNPNFKYEREPYVKKMQQYYNDLYGNTVTKPKITRPVSELSNVDGWIGSITSPTLSNQNGTISGGGGYYLPTYHFGEARQDPNTHKTINMGSFDALYNPYGTTTLRDAYMIDKKNLKDVDTNQVITDDNKLKSYIVGLKRGGSAPQTPPTMTQFFDYGQPTGPNYYAKKGGFGNPAKQNLYPWMQSMSQFFSPTYHSTYNPFNKADGGPNPQDPNLNGTFMNKTTDFVDWLRSESIDKLGNNFDQEMKKYGGININPSKKGTFTAAASKHGESVQSFASQVLANKDNYSPAMVKKANFARNASKWNHQEGGEYNEAPINTGMYGSYGNEDYFSDPRDIKRFIGKAQYGNQGECTDDEKMDPASPCYDPTFTPGYVTTVGDNQVSADQVYGTSNQPAATDPRMAPAPQVAQTPARMADQNQNQTNPMFGVQNQGDAMIAGLNFLTGIFSQDDNKDQERRMVGQMHADKMFMKDRRRNRGKYTVNEGYFDPLAMTPTQFKGYNTESPYGKMGGDMYKQGGEYYMSDDMIQKILDAGGTVEFLND